MALKKKLPISNSEQTSFRQLIITGNLFSKEYGVIVFEVSKGTQSFYYVINAITNGSSAFLPLFQRFAMHLKYINGGKHIFFNRLMLALKIKTEIEMALWLKDATIKILFYKTNDYVENINYRESLSSHAGKIREADLFAATLLKELSTKYKRNQILNFQVKKVKKQIFDSTKIVYEMIEMIGKK